MGDVINMQWTITRKAKNLLTYNLEVYAGSPQWYLDSNKLYFSCTATAGIRERLWLDKGTYTLSFNLDNCTSTLNVSIVDSYTGVAVTSQSYTTTGAKSLTVTTTYPALYGLRIYADSGSFTITNLQIESGSSATTYELPVNGAIAYDEELYGFDGVYDILDENGMLTKYWQRTTLVSDSSGNITLSGYKAGTNIICVNNTDGRTKILAAADTVATGWNSTSITVIYQLPSPVTTPINKPRILLTPGQNYIVPPQMSVIQITAEAKPEQFTTLHTDGLVTQTWPQLLTNKKLGSGTKLAANIDGNGYSLTNLLNMLLTGKIGVGTTAPSESIHAVGNILATGQLKSTVATGTPPLSVASTTMVANLNAEKVQGYIPPQQISQSVTNGTNVTAPVTGFVVWPDNTIQQVTKNTQYNPPATGTAIFIGLA